MCAEPKGGRAVRREEPRVRFKFSSATSRLCDVGKVTWPLCVRTILLNLRHLLYLPVKFLGGLKQ